MRPIGVGPSGMILRGLSKRCPWCGTDAGYRGLAIHPRCSACRLIFQPDPSDFLAAATVSYAAAGALWIVYLIAYLALALPDVNVPFLTVSSILVIVLGGLAFSRRAKTTWSALDLILCGGHRGLREEDAVRFGLRSSDGSPDQA